jgi:V/A-type H+/Na+-transporting ATPase subunit I
MIPVVVNKPELMAKMKVMAVRDRSDETLKTLQRIGVLHVEESETLTRIDREIIEKERRQISELLADIDSILSYIPGEEKVSPAVGVEVIYTRPYSETESTVKSICSRLGHMNQRAVQLEKEISESLELEKYIQTIAQKTSFKLKDLSFSGTYLFSHVYIFPGGIYERLPQNLTPYLFGTTIIASENETILHVVGKTSEQELIENTIKDYGGKVLQIADGEQRLKDFLTTNSDKILNLQNELATLRSEIVVEIRKNLGDLVLFREALYAENDKLGALQKASEAKYVTLFEGWIPKRNVEFATAELKEKIVYIYIETRPPSKKEKPPTKMNNPAVLRPFQVIVNLFGTPKYEEWDPTPIIAYSFALFFGIMLGDVVYAIGLILLTKIAIPHLVDDPESEGTALFKRILYISCGASMIVGLLTGTYLGDFYRFLGIENPELSTKISTIFGDTLLFIMLSLAIGLIHVNIAHLLALIKGIKAGQKYVIPGKLGLFLLQIAGIPWILNFLHMDFLSLSPLIYSILPYALLLSILLIIVSSIMEKGAFMGGIFWLFEITGILGDVMSYARLAGVGLATYYLAFCFNLMGPLLAGLLPVGIIRSVLGTIIIIAILLIGHMVNLILGSLTCFVHSLRLCFVEFLFKFFEGGGKQYRPFRLIKRELILVKDKV